LQALGGTLSTYIAKIGTQLDDILLIGDNDKTEKFQLSITNFNPLLMEVHPNWDKFCISNNFEIGNPLRFKFLTDDPLNPITRCHVFNPYVK
jgi:hypothetical protein